MFSTLVGMTAHVTRLLLLGAVRIFEPVNGYQIRRELVSWQVDRWAHINPGSIYSGLARLTRQGDLMRHDLVDSGREVAVYELTRAGREQFEQLLTESLETVDIYDRSGFTAAFSMLSQIDDDRALACLSTRLKAMQDVVAGFGRIEEDVAPPQAVRGWQLWRDLADSELSWLGETITQLRGGMFSGQWRPREDDPGWQMAKDRERYRALLDRV